MLRPDDVQCDVFYKDTLLLPIHNFYIAVGFQVRRNMECWIGVTVNLILECKVEI